MLLRVLWGIGVVQKVFPRVLREIGGAPEHLQPPLAGTPTYNEHIGESARARGTISRGSRSVASSTCGRGVTWAKDASLAPI